MRSLFIDTATSLLRIAVIDDNAVFQTSYETIRDHAKHTLFEIDKLLKENKLEPNDIDCIYVVNGPGSFTGLRIGVTIGKVYAYTLNKKVIPISLLKAQIVTNEKADYYVSVLKDKNNFVYAYIKDKENKTILDEQYIDIEELYNVINELDGQVLAIGDVEINVVATKKPNFDIKLIIDYFKNDTGINPHQLKPNYIKKIEVEKC